MAQQRERGRSAATETTPISSLSTLQYTDSPDWRQQLDDDIEAVERYRHCLTTLLRQLKRKREILEGLCLRVYEVQPAQ
jgi:hypothetical protein